MSDSGSTTKLLVLGDDSSPSADLAWWIRDVVVTIITVGASRAHC